MDTLPLPPRPNVEQYKKRAKDLVTAARSKDHDAVRAWATEWLETLARLRGVEITPFVQSSFDRAVEAIEERVRQQVTAPRAAGTRFALADAQFLMARAHGFESWSTFAGHIERMSRDGTDNQAFEAAVDAVVGGDAATLETMIRGNSGLIHARSTRTHRATLLHYVAANGVEDFRQVTPPNAVDVAKLLLHAGSEVDALAETYGGGPGQTTMNLLVSSMHPAQAGLQAALVETLLDFGAAINGLDDRGSPLMTALAFDYHEAAETLARRGARVDNVLAAAALGRVDLVREFVVDKKTLRPGVPFVAPGWWGVPNDAQTHIALAFVWSCKFGRTAAAEYLLDLGMDPGVGDIDHMTGLHWAAGHRYLDLVERLLARGAPLDVRNTWGGTVLDSTVWFSGNPPIGYPPASPDRDYPAVVETLIRAGADVKEVTPFPTGNASIDDVLRRHGRRS